MQSEIKRWGNSAAVRLSSKILAQAKLDVSSPISIDVKAGRIGYRGGPGSTSEGQSALLRS